MNTLLNILLVSFGGHDSSVTTLGRAIGITIAIILIVGLAVWTKYSSNKKNK